MKSRESFVYNELILRCIQNKILDVYVKNLLGRYLKFKGLILSVNYKIHRYVHFACVETADMISK